MIVIKSKGKRFQSEQTVFLGQSLRHRNPGLAQNLGIFSRQIQLQLLDAAESTEKRHHVPDLIRHLLVITHLLDLRKRVVFIGVHGVVDASGIQL